MCDALAMFGTKDSGKVLVNSNFFELDELNNPLAYSYAELSIRKICLNLYKTLKNVMPGFENCVLTHVGSELGCRKSRFLNGREVIDTLLYPREHDHVIGVVPTIDKRADNGFFGKGTVDLSYESILPVFNENLLVGTAKGMSARWGARTFLRYQPACMLVGQSAGTAAALAALNGVSTHGLNVRSLQKELLKADVWLGGPQRLGALGLV
jgi:hypothetical protein